MARLAKSYKAAAGKLEEDKTYPLGEAFGLISEIKRTKFDETVDLAVRLGVDPKHADQMVRGVVSLPHGTGKKVRVLVFAKGDKESEAKEAGADFVGAEDLIEKIEKENWLDFDQVISTPDMMRTVSKVAKVLGPRGLMPNPKTGTVTFDVGEAVKQVKAGRIEFRVEKAGIVHTTIGKASFGADQLKDNFLSVMGALFKAKPSSAKGSYLKSVFVSTTMGPSIKLDPAEITKVAKV